MHQQQQQAQPPKRQIWVMLPQVVVTAAVAALDET
jgi:hypothetical protein